MKETLHRFRSAELGNERSIWINEPAEPATHLLLFLDGEVYREKIAAPSLLAELGARGEIGPTLAVFISMGSPASRWLECPCNPRFARFVDEEVFPWLEELHPVVRGVQERVVAGLSYSGLAAAYVALMAPRHFTKVIAQSGSFWWNDGWLTRKLDPLRPQPMPRFYLSAGARETQTNLRHKEDVFQDISQLEGVRRFHAALIRKGAEAELAEIEGGRHEFETWRRDLPTALTWAIPSLATAK